MASPSSSSSRQSLPLHRSPLFTPVSIIHITDDSEANGAAVAATLKGRNKTRIPELGKEEEEERPKQPAPKKKDRQLSVLFDNCRPSRDHPKPSVVPLHNYDTIPNHKALLTLARKSPRPSTSAPPPSDADEWRLADHELSRKLLNAICKRDEALLESSRLKCSLAALEQKLCHLNATIWPSADEFSASVSAARSAVRSLSRSLSLHARPARIASLLHLEALLNKIFHSDFEKPGLIETLTLDPEARRERNRASYKAVCNLTWDDVLLKGTRHYCEGLSRFCNEKMGEIAAAVGWARAWPESLLQAFFAAVRGVWGVRLLARCGHPPATVMRAGRGMEFDGRYMEEEVTGGEGTGVVRVMVAPGFYLGNGGVVKCRVVCGYCNSMSQLKIGRTD